MFIFFDVVGCGLWLAICVGLWLAVSAVREDLLLNLTAIIQRFNVPQSPHVTALIAFLCSPEQVADNTWTSSTFRVDML
jgi:hypothetical protein